MKLTLIAVGHKAPQWINTGIAEYTKRMPRELPITLIEVKPEPRSSKTREQILSSEKARIRPVLSGFPRVIVLDERGDDLNTLALAKCLSGWMEEGGDTAFLIGGADGLDPSLKTEAHAMLRLSSLTLPHHLVRLLLVEQLYRAYSVVRHHPYHREG